MYSIRSFWVPYICTTATSSALSEPYNVWEKSIFRPYKKLNLLRRKAESYIFKIQISLFLTTAQHGNSKCGWIPSNVNSYTFTLYDLALIIKFNGQAQKPYCSWTQSYPESIPGSTGLIFEAADEQCLEIPLPSRGINIQIVIYMERKQLNLK